MAVDSSYLIEPGASPDAIKRRRQIAEALMLRGTDTSPIASPWQGAARMAQALMGGIELGQMDKRERENDQFNQSILSKEFGGGTAPSVAEALAAKPPSFTQTGGKMAQAPSDLMPYFEEASKMTGIPAPVLMAKVQQESSFNPNAIGKAGEIGLAQIMPSTARSPGFGMMGISPDSLRDPKTNIMFGAQYLAARGKAAGVNDWTNPNQVAKALTAYNGGGDPNYAQNVMRFLPKGGISPVTQALAGQEGSPSLQGGTDTLEPTRVAQAAPAGNTASDANRLLMLMSDPRTTPQAKQALMLKYQSMQKDPTVELQRQQLQFNIEEAKRRAARESANDPIDREAKQTDLELKKRQLAGEGAMPVTPEERQQYGIPPELPVYKTRDGSLKFGPVGTKVSVDASQKSEGEFEKKVAEGQAKLFNGMAEEGVNAKADLGQIRALRGQIGTLPGGFLGGAQALASQYGIKLGPNASNIEAAQAIISKLVPTQKAPGSGTISDRDLDLFKSSLPALSNTPGGNAMILDTMEALSIHKQRQADIATAVLTGEKTRKDAMKELRDLPDPLENVTKAIRSMKKDGTTTPAPAGGGVPDGVDPKIWEHMTPEERKLWN